MSASPDNEGLSNNQTNSGSGTFVGRDNYGPIYAIDEATKAALRKISREAKLRNPRAQILVMCGMSLLQEEKYAEAAPILERALQISEELAHDQPHFKAAAATNQYLLAVCMDGLGDAVSARDLAGEAGTMFLDLLDDQPWLAPEVVRVIRFCADATARIGDDPEGAVGMAYNALQVSLEYRNEKHSEELGEDQEIEELYAPIGTLLKVLETVGRADEAAEIMRRFGIENS